MSMRHGDRVRSRAFAQLILAETLAESGQVAEAAAHGHAVCGVLPNLNSARVREKVRALAVTLREHRAVSEVRDLLYAWDNVGGNRSEDSDEWPV